MTTARELITLALKEIGAVGQGQAISSEEAEDGLKRLNMMVAQWSRKRTFVYRLENVSFVGTGATPLTIGQGGDINTDRPAKIASAYARIAASAGGIPSDIKLTVLDAREDYDAIATKDLQSFPNAVFLDTAFPLANLYVWPIPDSKYTIFLSLMQQFTQFANLSDEIDLPPEYEEAIMYNLGVRLAPSFGLQVMDDTRRMAMASINTLEQANNQIPVLSMPNQVNTKGRYNVYGDNVT